MKCKKCETEMVIGQAIKPRGDENAIPIVPWGNITNETLEIINVWKCPNCGHSEFIEE
jgi:RNase P subunit RPR2